MELSKHTHKFPRNFIYDILELRVQWRRHGVVEMVPQMGEDVYCSSILAHDKCTPFVYYHWSKIGGENDPE